MSNRSIRQRPTARFRLRFLQSVVLGGFLAGTLAVFVGPMVSVSAAASTTVATSASSQAFQYSAQDRTAYLPDGSLLVGYWQSTTPAGAYINRVTNPSTTPVSTNLQFISGGDEVSIITSGNDIWIQVGSELDGLPKLEQVLHGIYLGGNSFSWPTLPQIIPGALTTGRQDPSLAWNGTDLIATWWDDTMGGNSDNIFYNWTADKSGATGWAVGDKTGTVASTFTPRSGTTAAALTIKNGTTAAATSAPSSTITYTPGDLNAPAVGDWFNFGAGTINSEIAQVSGVVGPSPYTLTLATPLAKAHAMGEADTTATTITYTAGTGAAPAVGDVFEFGNGVGTSETRTVTAVSGSGPYVLSVAALANSHGSGEADTTTTRISYTAGTGGAPLVNDRLQIGKGNNCPCDAELRQVTGVSGSGPYILSVAPLLNPHAAGAPYRIEALEFSSTGTNSVQVALRHSTHYNATIAVYGTRCNIWSRTLADGNNPTSGWSAESLVDASHDDCEGNFGGPVIAIDETNGNIHVFKAVTNSNSPGWSGITYWLGHLSGSTVSFGSRVVIDATGVTATEPPDITGAVDSTGKVYVVWATAVSGGSIKMATLTSPYTTPSAITTVATTGANPRFPHIPAQAPLTGGYVPLFYQSGTGPYNITLDTDPIAPTVPTNLTATFVQTPEVDLSWTASTDNVAVTGYTIYRNGTMLNTVPGTTYADKAVTVPANYSYTVDAFDAAGNHSAQSVAATVGTVDTVPPSVPTGLAAGLSSHNVVLTWNASTDNVGVTGYRIWRDGATLASVGNVLTYTDTTAAALTTYTYTVDAFDAAGNHSAQSSPAQITTPTASSCTTVNLTTTPVSPGPTGGSVLMTATSTGCPNPVYRFWIKDPGRRWSTVQNFSPASTHTWTQTYYLGTTLMEVDVRDASENTVYDVVHNITFTTIGCTTAGISFNPVSPQGHGTAVTFTGSSICPGSAAEYRFWIQDPGRRWSMVQNFSTNNVYNWAATSTYAVGTYKIEVDVRNAGSGEIYEVVYNTTYNMT